MLLPLQVLRETYLPTDVPILRPAWPLTRTKTDPTSFSAARDGHAISLASELSALQRAEQATTTLPGKHTEV